MGPSPAAGAAAAGGDSSDVTSDVDVLTSPVDNNNEDEATYATARRRRVSTGSRRSSSGSTSKDWGGSRVLSQSEEDALFLAEFMRQFWHVFVPARTSPPREVADKSSSDTNGAGTAAAVAATESTSTATAAATLIDDTGEVGESSARNSADDTTAPASRISSTSSTCREDEKKDDDKRCGGDAGHAVADSPRDGDKQRKESAAPVSPGQESRPPPKITPRIVQDAARILAEREKELYRVGNVSDSPTGTAVDAGAEANTDTEAATGKDAADHVEEDCAAALRDMEQMLLRLGVLGTKALAEEVLVVHPPARTYTGKKRGRKPANVDDTASEDDKVAFSALLNLPGSCHFRKLLGSVKLDDSLVGPSFMRLRADENADKPRALPLPPNMLTYRSYLRLSLMVSCLSSADDVSEACKSPLCAFLPSLSIGNGLKPSRGVENTHHKKDSDHGKDGGSGGKRRSPPKLDRDSSQGQHSQSAGWTWARNTEAALLSESSSLTGSDIVALWVRAQRNSSAWRQLIGMFRFDAASCTTIGSESSDIMNAHGVGAEDRNLVPDYRAVYLGNHKNTAKRTDGESKQVDSLITWAASNQVLFTWDRIREDLQLGLFPESQGGGSQTFSGGRTGKRKSSDESNGRREGKKAAKRSLGDTPAGRTTENLSALESPSSSPNWIMSYYRPQFAISSTFEDTSSRQELPRGVLVALQSFALRLLSTIHRPILTMLYNKDPKSFLVRGDRSCRLLSTLVAENIPDKVKKEMLNWKTKTSDRTFARIGRRCLAGKYIPDPAAGEQGAYPIQDIHLNFFELVKAVMKALLHSLPADAVKARAATAAAISDWTLIRECYLTRLQTDTGQMESLSSLAGDEVSIDKLPALLSALPAPWDPKKCHVCQDDLPGASSSPLAAVDASVRTCSCCNISVHVKCRPHDKGTAPSLSTLLRSYDPLRRIYSLRSPDSLVAIPDYANPSLRDSIEWSRHVITLKRTLVQGERAPSWGMGINHLESASDVLDDILGGLYDVTAVSSAEVANEVSCRFPLRLDSPGSKTTGDAFKAIFVGSISPGKVAEESGVKKGDIIAAIGVVPNENATADNDDTSSSSAYFHDLAGKSKDERVNLFKRQEVSEMRLHIFRSDNIDLARISEEFLEASKKLSSSVLGTFATDEGETFLAENRWYCSDCRLSQDAGSFLAGRSRSIHHEASCCRSVVRRLAVDWYARPFLNEDQDQDAGTGSTSNLKHKQHVSLRRLDGMFCSIMEKYANHDSTTGEATSTSPNSAVPAAATAKEDNGIPETSPFFLLPPWSVSSRARLDWAPREMEKDPFRLLCKGIELILTPPSNTCDSDGLQDERKELARHFLPLFSSYCLDSSTSWIPAEASVNDGVSGSAFVRGPPNTIVRLCLPFLRRPCNCCGVRASKSDDKLEGFCSEACKRALSNGWLTNSALLTSAATGTSSATSKARTSSNSEAKCQAYDINSSFVGSTILVLPGDPLLEGLWTKLQMQHEHCNRPVEMVVASYLPFNFTGIDGLSEHGVYGDPLARQKNGFGNVAQGDDKAVFLSRPDVVEGGVFQLIPVLNSHQLKFVLERCKLRSPPKGSGKRSNTRGAKKVWTDVDALQLHGIIHLSLSELRHRLAITRSLCSAIDSSVAEIAARFGSKCIQLSSGTDTGRNQDEALSNNGEVNACGPVGIVNESPSRASSTNLLRQQPSDGVIPFGSKKALRTLGDFEYNCMDSSLPATHFAAARLGECTSLADALTNSGASIIRGVLRRKLPCVSNIDVESSADPDLDGDTDIDEEEAFDLESARKRNKLVGTSVTSILSPDGQIPSSPIASGYAELLDPTPFEASQECTTCYSDIVVFKADLRQARGKGRGDSLARRLEAEREAAQLLESSNQSHIILNRPQLFAAFSEKQLSRIPSPPKPFSAPSDEGGKFDVILHRLSSDSQEEITAVAQGTSDDEWAPDKEEEGASSTHGSRAASAASSFPQFKGRGWGMELLRWRKDKGRTLRVGRIFPSSPAAKAGLRPNDIVLAINARSFEALKCDDVIASEMLGRRLDMDVSSAGTTAAVNILSGTKVVVGPVALQILRVPPRREPPQRARSQTHGRSVSHSVGNIPNPPRQQHEPPTNLQRVGFDHLDQEVRQIPVEQEGAASRPVQLQHQQQHQQQWHLHQQQAPPIADRRPLAVNDLYKQGDPNSVLTRVETVVFAEAVEQQQPKLGFRLLLPRYPNEVLITEYRNTITSVLNSPFRWPKLSPRHWQELMKADYKRSEKEVGPIVEHEGDWTYKKPVQVLPIDRLIEQYFKSDAAEQGQQNHEHLGEEAARHETLRRRQLQQQDAARQETLRRQQQQEAARRELAQRQAAQAARALAAIEMQKRQLAEQEEAQSRVLAQAQQVAGQVANPLDAQPEMLQAFVPPREEVGTRVVANDQAQQQGPAQPQNYNVDAAARDVIDLCDEDDSLPRIRGGGEDGESAGEKGDRSTPVANGYPLNQIPPADWKGFVVTGECMTAMAKGDGRNMIRETTSFLGVVNELSPPDNDEVSVLVFFLFKRNFFLPPDRIGMHKVKVAHLYAAFEGSREESIYDEWTRNSKKDLEGVKFYPALSGDSSQTATRKGGEDEDQAQLVNRDIDTTTHGSGTPSLVTVSSPAISQDQNNASLHSAAVLLVNRLSQRTSSLLGYLPDGRAIIWLQSDPEAVYLRSQGDPCQWKDDSAGTRQFEYIASIARVSKKKNGLVLPSCSGEEPKLCCMWGCSRPCEGDGNDDKARQVLSFDTQEDLTLHEYSHHRYFEGHDELRSTQGDCVRLSSGAMLKKLCADLTMACCARCPDLLGHTVPIKLLSSDVASTLSTQASVLLDFHLSGSESMDASSIATATAGCVEVQRMIRLGSRICRLFAIESNGQYRLSLPDTENYDNREEGCAQHGDNADEAELLSSIQRDIEAGQQTMSPQGSPPKERSTAGYEDRCVCATLDSNNFTSASERANCSLCFAEAEQIVEAHSAASTCTPETPQEQQPTNLRGIGCALLSDFMPDMPVGRNAMKDAQMLAAINELAGKRISQLETLKVMLLRIARRLPPSLYTNNSSASGASVEDEEVDSAKVSIWGDENLRVWRSFVKHSANERMLSLAFVLLINSLNKNRMPNWWKAKKSGWCSPFMSLQGQNLSSLAMNMYILDAALVDKFPSFSDGNLSVSGGGRSEKRDPRKEKVSSASRKNATNKFFDRLQRMGVAHRMTTGVEWAKQSGIVPWEGDHNDRCAQCQEVGNLLCCEFCCDSYHALCLGVKGADDDISHTFDDIPFTCEQCLLDISLLYQEQQES